MKRRKERMGWVQGEEEKEGEMDSIVSRVTEQSDTDGTHLGV